MIEMLFRSKVNVQTWFVYVQNTHIGANAGQWGFNQANLFDRNFGAGESQINP